jgi:hypothetical protein
VYSGADTTVLGGTRITTQCCAATKFDDDDAIAIDLGDICNSAGSLRSSILVMVVVSMVAVVISIVG